AALDLAAGRIIYRIRERKRWREFLGFCKILRRRWPGQRLYLVLDNFSPHKRSEVVTSCQTNNIELVFTPANAAYCKCIECEFAVQHYLALASTDHRAHTGQNAAIATYVDWRNTRAQTIHHSAINSLIQNPHYRVNGNRRST